MIKKFSPLVCVLVLWSCGAGSNESSVITPTDTISSTATVRFNTTTSQVEVLETGPDPKSETFDVCTFSMDSVTGELPYSLLSANTLSFNGANFSFKRSLKSPKTKAGVADRIFSVWGSQDITVEGVTLSQELEIEPELLIFRMTCTA